MLLWIRPFRKKTWDDATLRGEKTSLCTHSACHKQHKPARVVQLFKFTIFRHSATLQVLYKRQRIGHFSPYNRNFATSNTRWLSLSSQSHPGWVPHSACDVRRGTAGKGANISPKYPKPTLTERPFAFHEYLLQPGPLVENAEGIKRNPAASQLSKNK